MKQVVALRTQSKAPKGVVAYLADIRKGERADAGLTEQDLLDPRFQLRALRVRSSFLIHQLAGLIGSEAKETGVTHAVAFERHSAQCVPVTRAHAYAFMAQCFQEGVDQAPKELQPILKLCVDMGRTRARIGSRGTAWLLVAHRLMCSSVCVFALSLPPRRLQQLRPVRPA